MSEEMSIKQQQKKKKKNWIHLAGCDWAQLLQFQPEIENCRVRGCTEIFMQPPHIFRLIFAYAYIIIYA